MRVAYRCSVHPFRFAVTASHARDAEAWRGLARRAEELGYASLLVPDHLGTQLSPIAAMATAAAVTDRLRIGGFVFANDFRHPLVLAREAATLDLLSNGRLELGLGAGWRTADYRQLGVLVRRAGQAHRSAGGGDRARQAAAHRRDGDARRRALPARAPRSAARDRCSGRTRRS